MDKGEIKNEKENKTHILETLELHTVVFSGISIMIGGEIKMYHFLLTWLAILALIWFRLPLNDR